MGLMPVVIGQECDFGEFKWQTRVIPYFIAEKRTASLVVVRLFSPTPFGMRHDRMTTSGRTPTPVLSISAIGNQRLRRAVEDW